MALTKNPITITVGLAVFLFWLNIVGNPHVVETVLGLVIGIAAAIYVRKAILNRFLPYSCFGGKINIPPVFPVTSTLSFLTRPVLSKTSLAAEITCLALSASGLSRTDVRA